MPSTVIRAYSYDAKRARLDIAFVSGESYSYFDVPEAVVTAFGQAFSKGRFFQAHIRDQFAYRRDRRRVRASGGG